MLEVFIARVSIQRKTNRETTHPSFALQKGKLMFPVAFTLTNGCTCTIYDETTDSTKLDEYGDPVRPEYCYGDCFTEERNNLDEIVIREWHRRNGITKDDEVVVKGSKMNWNRVSGLTVTQADVDSIIDTLNIDTDWNLQFNLERDGRLSCTRSSHDEPTGAYLSLIHI